MKFIYFGTPSESVIVLNELLRNNLIPTVIVTAPDRPFGRKRELTPPPVKVWAIENKIKILQPVKLKDPKFLDELHKQNPDVCVLAGYGKIIPKEVLEIFPKGILNIHPSLLPLFRGPTPVQSAIISGEKKTGVSIMLLDEETDHGPVFSQKEVLIEEKTKAELDSELWTIGAQELAKIIEPWISNKIYPKEQNHELATYTKKFTIDDAFIESKMILEGGEANEINLAAQKIRALNPEPGTWTIIKTKAGETRVKILSVRIRDNKIIPEKIVPAGKREMMWQDFLKGNLLG